MKDLQPHSVFQCVMEPSFSGVVDIARFICFSAFCCIAAFYFYFALSTFYLKLCCMHDQLNNKFKTQKIIQLL